MRLTDLGIPKLWKEDTELLWPYALRPGVAVWLLTHLAPGSHGYGLDRVPLDGGLVVAANHFASLDHPLIGIFSPRAIYYMAKKELLDMPDHRRAADLDGRISGQARVGRPRGAA